MVRAKKKKSKIYKLFFIPTPILENIDDISRNLLKYSFVIVWFRDEIDAINICDT